MKGSSKTGAIKAVASGVGFGIVVTLLGAVVCTALIMTESISQKAMNGCCAGIWFISAWVAGSVAAGKLKEKRLLVSIGTGACYLICLLAMGLIFGNGFERVGIGAAACLGGGGISAILGTVVTGGGGRRHKFKGFR